MQIEDLNKSIICIWDSSDSRQCCTFKLRTKKQYYGPKNYHPQLISIIESIIKDISMKSPINPPRSMIFIFLISLLLLTPITLIGIIAAILSAFPKSLTVAFIVFISIGWIFVFTMLMVIACNHPENVKAHKTKTSKMQRFLGSRENDYKARLAPFGWSLKWSVTDKSVWNEPRTERTRNRNGSYRTRHVPGYYCYYPIAEVDFFEMPIGRRPIHGGMQPFMGMGLMR